MAWTTETPKEEGWYWWRHEDGSHKEAMRVYESSIYPGKFVTNRGLFAELVEDLGGVWYTDKIQEPQDTGATRLTKQETFKTVEDLYEACKTLHKLFEQVIQNATAASTESGYNSLVKLSDRIRPNSEAAPWVVEEVRKLEHELNTLYNRSINLEKDLAQAYLEMVKQRPALIAIFDRDAWDKAERYHKDKKS